MRTNYRTARALAIVGIASIAIAIIVSITTDESADWSWGAMILTSLMGVVLLAGAALVGVNHWRRSHIEL